MLWFFNYSVNNQIANMNMRVMQQKIMVNLNVKSNKKYSKAIFRTAVLVCPSSKVYIGTDTGNKCKHQDTLNNKLKCCDMCKGYYYYPSAYSYLSTVSICSKP